MFASKEMNSKQTIFVSGGAGFIGSELIRHLLNNSIHKIVNIVKLTYSGNLQLLESIDSKNNYFFERLDICDDRELQRVFNDNKPDLVIHLAAESHVNRSIDGPKEFFQTNIFGNFNLPRNQGIIG